MFSFNSIGFTVFGIPGYLFFSGIGIIIAVSAFFILCIIKRYRFHIRPGYVIFTATAVLGFARLFGFLSVYYWELGRLGFTQLPTIHTVAESGIVFYGGLFGFLIVCLSATKCGVCDSAMLNLMTVCIPLFHVFARIDCFTAGCCYGAENHSWFAVYYCILVNGITDTTYRLPVQLYESLMELMLFLILLYQVCSEDWQKKRLLRQYLLFYSIGRYLLEFLRGDSLRGVVLGTSFSQIICIFIWIGLIAIKAKEKYE